MNKDNKRIFIVDDDLIYLEIMKHELSSLENVEVEAFTSAESCLQQIDKRPDLIIIDCHLDSDDPDNMTGLEALEHFRTYDFSPKILFVSGNAQDRLLRSFEEDDAVDFISKNQPEENSLINKVKDQLYAA